jgi:hypothetical protein
MSGRKDHPVTGTYLCFGGRLSFGKSWVNNMAMNNYCKITTGWNAFSDALVLCGLPGALLRLTGGHRAH